MKWLWGPLLALLLPCLALAAPTVTQTGSLAQGTGSLTLTITTTADSPAGNTDVVLAALGGAAPNDIVSVADSAGNTYTAGTGVGSGSTYTAVKPFYCQNCLHLPSSGTITITYSVTAFRQYALSTTISDMATASFDLQGSGFQVVSTTPSITTGTLASTPFVAVVGFSAISSGFADTFTEASGFTTLGSIGLGSNSILRVSYQIVSAPTPVTYAPTLGTSRNVSGNVIAFQSPGLAGANHNLLLLGVGD